MLKRYLESWSIYNVPYFGLRSAPHFGQKLESDGILFLHCGHIARIVWALEGCWGWWDCIIIGSCLLSLGITNPMISNKKPKSPPPITRRLINGIHQNNTNPTNPANNKKPPTPTIIIFIRVAPRKLLSWLLISFMVHSLARAKT